MSEHDKKHEDILQPSDAKKPLKLTKQEIGRHTWALLHSVASAFPSIPTAEDQKNIENLIHSLAKVFPCKVCGVHFQKLLKDYPIRHKSREELGYYLCEIHNVVNKHLHKPIFDCKNVFDLWGGDCGCEAE